MTSPPFEAEARRFTAFAMLSVAANTFARHNETMGALVGGIDNELATWLAQQPVFFVATAPSGADGHVNCSPKGNRGEFSVIDPTTIAYLDQTGSGIETIAHLRENGRITVMFCAFGGAPRIVRLQGHGTFVAKDEPGFGKLVSHFASTAGVGARAAIVVKLDRVADSCGFGVPLMTFNRHRPALDAWAERKGPDGVAAYRAKHNAKSIDDLAGLDPSTDNG